MAAASADPTAHLFWIASRSMGAVAMLLVSLSVGLGLGLSARVGSRPGSAARLKTLHEAMSLVALMAIAAHGLLLLGDSYLRPGLAGVALPFALQVNWLWTGLGVIAGWLALVVGLSFYVRRWIGIGVWRWLHRWTLAVYVLGIAHTLGAGTDAASGWLIGLLAIAAAPIAYLGTLRVLPRPSVRGQPA